MMTEDQKKLIKKRALDVFERVVFYTDDHKVAIECMRVLDGTFCLQLTAKSNSFVIKRVYDEKVIDGLMFGGDPYLYSVDCFIDAAHRHISEAELQCKAIERALDNAEQDRRQAIRDDEEIKEQVRNRR